MQPRRFCLITGLLIALALSVTGVSATWYNNNFLTKTQILVSNATAALTNWPYLVNGTWGMNNSTYNSSRIVLTDSTEAVPLLFELEAGCSSGYCAWARNNISTSNVTEYVYFNNSGASRNDSITAVWSQETGAVMHWSLDGTGTNAMDSAAMNNNFTLGTNVNFNTTGCKIGGCLNLTTAAGTSAFNSVTGITTTTAYTFTTWIKIGTLGSNYYDVVYKGGSGEELMLQSTAGPNCDASHICINWNTPGVTPAGTPISFNMTSGVWYQVTLTYDGSYKRYYLNGTLINSTASTGTPSSSGGTSFYLGSNSGGSYKWPGALDETRILQRVMTADEIKYLYLSTAGVSNYANLNMTSYLGGGGGSAPSISINLPANTTYAVSNTTFNYAASSSESPFTLKAWIDNSLIFNSSAYTGIPLLNYSVLSDGGHNFTVYASNSFGSATQPLIFTIDTTPPTVTLQSPVNQSYPIYLGQSYQVNLNYTSTDISGVSYCWYSLDGGSNTSLAPCINSTLQITTAGNHSLYVYSNDTLGNTGYAYSNFFVDFENQIRVQDAITPATYYDFSANLMNASYNVSNSSLSKVAHFWTSQIPYGTTVLVDLTGTGFNNTWAVLSNLNSSNSSVFNQTFTVYPAAVTIVNVYDEYSMAAICYNYTFSNTSFSTSGQSCGSTTYGYAALPTGTNVELTISNTSYISRTYFLTINSYSYLSLNGYLLGSTAGSYITYFTYSTSAPGGQPNVLINAMRYLNSSWTVIGQQYSDSQGKGYLYLYPFTSYRITAQYGVLSADINPYYPNPSFILYIPLNGSSTAVNLTWVFDSVSIVYTPTYPYWSGVIPINYLIQDSANDLTYYGITLYQVFQNGTTVQLYYNRITTAPAGGAIAVNLNISNTTSATARFLSVINFKRSGYAEWNTTYSYFLSYFNVNSSFFGGNISYPVNIIPEILGNFTAGNLGPKSQVGIGIVTVFVAGISGVAVAAEGIRRGYPSTLGGSLTFIGVLSLITVASNGVMFPWPLLLLMGLAVAGINLWRYG